MLYPQESIEFVQLPAGHRTVPTPHAGLLSFSVAHAGRYLLSADEPAWIDVLAGGRALESIASAGGARCA